jgi:hypothetical protein
LARRTVPRLTRGIASSGYWVRPEATWKRPSDLLLRSINSKCKMQNAKNTDSVCRRCFEPIVATHTVLHLAF